MRISQSVLESYLAKCSKKKINAVWNGHGSALFVELGNLQRLTRNGKTMIHDCGEISLYIVWEWRIERKRSILVGSASTQKQLTNRISSINGKHIERIDIEGRLPELNISISDNYWIKTCTMWQGQPEWAINFRESEEMLLVRNGVIHLVKTDQH